MKQSATHVRPSVPRVSAPRSSDLDMVVPHDLQVLSDRVQDPETGVDMHSYGGHVAISRELVACTLGQRVRPELVMDWRGDLIRTSRAALLRIRDSLRVGAR